MKKEIEIKPVEPIPEPVETVKPIEEKTALTEKEAQHVMSKIIDISVIYQSMLNLPESSKIDKNSNFYIDEILRILIDHGIITP